MFRFEGLVPTTKIPIILCPLTDLINEEKIPKLLIKTRFFSKKELCFRLSFLGVMSHKNGLFSKPQSPNEHIFPVHGFGSKDLVD